MKNTQKGFIAPVLIAVVALLVIGGGVYVYINQQVKAPALTTNQVENTMATTSDSSVKTQATSTSQNNNVAKISVDGMQQYTDSDFGFSFWYPTNWTVVSKKQVDPNDGGYYLNGSISKVIIVSNPKSPTIGVTLEEFSSPTFSIKEMGQTLTANPDGVDQEYYFDKNTHAWMYENFTDINTGNGIDRPEKTITTADISDNTIGGLHIFPGALRFGTNSIVPLSARNFLIISNNSPTGDTPQQYPLIKTIVATNPAVATPLNITLQEQVIQAEKKNYSGQ